MRHRLASDAINNAVANPAVVLKLLSHAVMETLTKNYFHKNSQASHKALADQEEAFGPLNYLYPFPEPRQTV